MPGHALAVELVGYFFRNVLVSAALTLLPRFNTTRASAALSFSLWLAWLSRPK